MENHCNLEAIDFQFNLFNIKILNMSYNVMGVTYLEKISYFYTYNLGVLPTKL